MEKIFYFNCIKSSLSSACWSILGELLLSRISGELIISSRGILGIMHLNFNHSFSWIRENLFRSRACSSFSSICSIGWKEFGFRFHCCWCKYTIARMLTFARLWMKMVGLSSHIDKFMMILLRISTILLG